jgi:hypothetical protein
MEEMLFDDPIGAFTVAAHVIQVIEIGIMYSYPSMAMVTPCPAD